MSAPTNETLLRIEVKIDRIDDRLGGIDVTLARQSEQLGEHMRRTEAAERNLLHLQTEIKPLAKAHAAWSGVGKAVTVLATSLGIISAAIRLLGRH